MFSSRAWPASGSAASPGAMLRLQRTPSNGAWATAQQIRRREAASGSGWQPRPGLFQRNYVSTSSFVSRFLPQANTPRALPASQARTLAYSWARPSGSPGRPRSASNNRARSEPLAALRFVSKQTCRSFILS